MTAVRLLGEKKTAHILLALVLAALSASGLILAQSAVAPEAAQAATPSCDASASVEEHRFSGSSTSVAVFEAWFAGGDFVQPAIETLDLRPLKVNDTQTAEPGDIVVKDAQGNFWVKSSHC